MVGYFLSLAVTINTFTMEEEYLFLQTNTIGTHKTRDNTHQKKKNVLGMVTMKKTSMRYRRPTHMQTALKRIQQDF